jgi:alpha-galactosidase
MRIGPDVAPSWTVRRGAWNPAGYGECEPAVGNAWRNTLTRAFQHRRLWLNDPDCLMLRTTDTDLSPAQIDAWARAVAVSGGMALLSDDLARLGPAERDRLEAVLEVGRACDDAAKAGTTARCPDLLDTWSPRELVNGNERAVVPE